MNLTSIPALQDNYIWVLSDQKGKCLIVDPGDAMPVLKEIDEQNWQPEAILLTHHHNDHVDGVAALVEKYPDIIVYGPEETLKKGVTRVVTGGDVVTVLGVDFQVIATPGHTLGHISWFASPWLFCGDTLFSGGCGRLFEGSAKQLYDALMTINKLPQQTLICCSHEYTESNLIFSLSISPENKNLNDYYRKVKELRAKKQSTLPSTLEIERKINLFIRVNDTDFIKEIRDKTNLQQPEDIFRWLRTNKDKF